MNRSEVDGFRLRLGWDVLQPAETTLDFQPFKDTLALAKAHDKKIGLSVSSGISYPKWLDAKGAQIVNVTTPNGILPMPWPWDPVVLPYWQQFWNSFGAVFDQDETLVYMVMSGMGWGQGCDVVHTPSDIAAFNAAGGLPAWTTATRAICGYYIAAFQRTPCLLQVNPVIPTTEGGQAFSDMGNWYASAYTQRSGFMFEGWLASQKQPTGLWGPMFSAYCDKHPCDLQQFGPASAGKFGGSVPQGVGNLPKLGHPDAPPWIVEVYEEDLIDANKGPWTTAGTILTDAYKP